MDKMIVNFDKYIDNRNKHLAKFDSLKTLYNADPDTSISMWVADMDFNPPQSVIDAMDMEIKHGVFGYYGNHESYLDSVTKWMKERYNWNIQPEWCSVVHGVNSGIGIGIRAFSDPGDEVIVFSPIYHSFYQTIKNNNRIAKQIPLAIENEQYELDFEALEKNLSGKEKILIFSSPHNPGGKIWSELDLKRLAEFCLKKRILIFMDEIHHDLTFKEKSHKTFLKAAPEAEELTIVFTAATKSFNIAGCHTGTTIIPNKKIYKIFDEAHKAFGKTPNRFGMIMTEAAYNGGVNWLDQLMVYLDKNRKTFFNGLKEINNIKLFKLESTYLAWVDFNGLGIKEDNLKSMLINEAKVVPNIGSQFGTTGLNFARFNLACRNEIVHLAVNRIKKTFS